MPWGNPVIGGANTLVRNAIMSPNYVAGVTGWIIRKDGTAEFNNITARGSITADSVSAGSGAVLVNSGGVRVTGSGVQYDINTVAGFLARMLPDDGSLGELISSILYLRPASPTPVNGVAVFTGQIWGRTINTAGVETPQLFIQAPQLTAKSGATVTMSAQTTASATDNSVISVDANNIQLNVATSGRTQFHRGETGATTLSFSALASTSFTVTFAKPYIAAPRVFTNIDTAPGSTARWCSRAINITTTQFTYFVFAADNVANTWASVPLSWGAYTLT